MSSVDDESVVRTVTRDIRVPPRLSEQAQRSLAAAPPVALGVAPLAVDDVDGWLARIAMVNAGIVAMYTPAMESFDGRIATITVDGVDVVDVQPATATTDDVIVLDIHGGGFIYGTGDAARAMACARSVELGRRVWCPDYRTPPAAPHPAALEDCLAVYRRLLQQYPASNIFVSAGSAGASIALAMLMRGHAEGLSLPRGVLLVKPLVDLTRSGDSYCTNLGVDHTLAGLVEPVQMYANGVDLGDPLLSPLFAELPSPWPPTIIVGGTRDMLLSDAVRIHRKLRAKGADADLHLWDAMPHAGFGGAPEDHELSAELRTFVDASLGKT